MGGHDPENWSATEATENDEAQQAPADTDAGPAAAGSLMSVQIRRARPPRKRPPCGPAEVPEPATRAPAATKEALAAAAAGAPAPRPATGNAAQDEARPAGEITTYWARLRGSRPYPSVADLDPDQIAVDWPNSILFRCRAGSGALEPDMSFLPRRESVGAGLSQDSDDGRIQLSPLMLQWLVSLAADAVRSQRPVEDTESFPSLQRAIGYRAVALPLSDDRSAIDHVLCHVRQA